jgi:hypothetical protein
MITQFDKFSTGATPICRGASTSVYTQDTGRTNADRRNGSAGGEVRRSEILDRASGLARPSLAGHR